MEPPQRVVPHFRDELVLISRHLERIGDHATNIGEDVIFIESGHDVQHDAREGPAV